MAKKKKKSWLAGFLKNISPVPGVKRIGKEYKSWGKNLHKSYLTWENEKRDKEDSERHANLLSVLQKGRSEKESDEKIKKLKKKLKESN